MTTKFNSWVTCPAPNPAAKIRLFCLPFAGGGASAYRQWSKHFSPEIEVCPIQLPGRENRFSEPAIKNAQQLAQQLANQLQMYANKPFAIYGHSMGALLAFETTRVLQRQGLPMPEVLFLGAHRAAHRPPKRKPMHTLDDNAFIQKLQTFGGFPDEVLASKELVQFLLPTLRADFSLCDSYVFEADDAPLECPMSLFAGEFDEEVTPEDMTDWQIHCAQMAQLHRLDGGHFFLRSHLDALVERMRISLLTTVE